MDGETRENELNRRRWFEINVTDASMISDIESVVGEAIKEQDEVFLKKANGIFNDFVEDEKLELVEKGDYDIDIAHSIYLKINDDGDVEKGYLKELHGSLGL